MSLFSIIKDEGVKEGSVLREYVESILLAVVISCIIIIFFVQSYIVSGASMEPTLYDGERLLVDKITYRFSEPRRGDIVVLDTNKPGPPYIKRIIGISGDHIEIRGGEVYLNGKMLNEPYIKEKTWLASGSFDVPHGKYFVMGDNRNHSEDSRLGVGYLDKKQIRGRALFRYFPFNRLKHFKRPQLLNE